MIAKLGGIITAMAGSLGGTTFQRYRAGLIVRNKPLPIYRNTRAASAARQRTATLNNVWAGFTLTEIADWQTFADTQVFTNRFGDVVASRAYAAFMRCNLASLVSDGTDLSFPIATTPPVSTYSLIPASPSLILKSGPAALQFDSADSVSEGDTTIVMWASRPKRPRPTDDKPTVQDGKVIGRWNGGETFPIDLTAPYIAAFGRLPVYGSGEGCNITLRVYNNTSGWPGLSTTLSMLEV